MLFIIRLLLSLIQFLLIAKSNIYLDELSSGLFIFGLRFFIILAPLTIIFFKNKTALWVFSSIIIGQILLIFYNIQIVSALIISFGLSLGAFLIRTKASENLSDASLNKVALHLGSIISGFIIFLALKSNKLFWNISLFLSSLCFITAITFFRNKDLLLKQSSKDFSLTSLHKIFSTENIFWAFTGLSLGIRSYAPYIILPQFLINTLGYLPDWYGFQISIYSIFVILFQIPTAFFKIAFSLKLTLVILLLSSVITGSLDYFNINNFSGVLIWLLILAIQELFSGTLDSLANKDKSLLSKEIFVGIGGGVSTIIMRYSNKVLLCSLISCTMVMISMVLIYRSRKIKL